MCTRTVFVGDLSYFCRESHLLQLFSSVGHVIDIDLKRNQEGESQLHAFVKFESEMSVPIAVEVYNGVKYMGRRMVVNGTSTRAQKKDYNNWYKLTIHFSATSDPSTGNNNNDEINEEFLDMLCAPYGILGDVIIRSHTRAVLPSSVQMNPAAMRQMSRNSPPLGVSESFAVNSNNNGPLVTVVSGYGVVFFLELTGANRALQSLHNTTVNHNILLTCNLSPRPNDLLMSNNSAGAAATHPTTHVSHSSPNTMYASQIPRHLHQSGNNSNASSPRSFASSHSSPNLGTMGDKTKPLYNNNMNVLNKNYITNMRKSPTSSPPQTFYPNHNAVMNNVHNNNVNVNSVNTHNMSPYQLQMLMQLEQQQQLLQQQKQMLLMQRSDSDLSRFTLQSNNHSNTVSNNASHNNSFAHLLATSDDFSNNSKSSSFYNSSSSSLSHNSSFIGSNYMNNNNSNNANNNNNMFNIPAINTAPNNPNVHQKFPTLYPSATTQTPKSYNAGHHINNAHPVSNTSLHQHYLTQPNTQMMQNSLGISGSLLGEPVSEFVAAPPRQVPSNAQSHHHPNTYQPSLDIIQSLLASNSFSAEDQTHSFPVVNISNNNFNNNSSAGNHAHINDSQFEVDSLIN